MIRDLTAPIAVLGCGRNSVVECQLPKLNAVGSSPIARLIELNDRVETKAGNLVNFR